MKERNKEATVNPSDTKKAILANVANRCWSVGPVLLLGAAPPQLAHTVSSFLSKALQSRQRDIMMCLSLPKSSR
jgi:hypothetical protein